MAQAISKSARLSLTEWQFFGRSFDRLVLADSCSSQPCQAHPQKLQSQPSRLHVPGVPQRQQRKYPADNDAGEHVQYDVLAGGQC